nr:nitroreductase family protein [Corynebacterium lactis]
MTESSASSAFADKFETLLRSRRATRVFDSAALPEPQVTRLLELSLEAPSGFNLQSRAIVRIDDPAVRAEVARAAGGQRQVIEAPLLLAFVGEPSGWREGGSLLADANLASGLWDTATAAERVAKMTDFQRKREEAGLSREFAIRDAMIAASFAMVTATALGWASSPMTGFDEQAVKEAIGAGETDIVVALLLAVGKPGENPPHPGRFPVEQRVYADRYRG